MLFIDVFDIIDRSSCFLLRPVIYVLNCSELESSTNTYQEGQLVDKHNVDGNFQTRVHAQDIFGDTEVFGDYSFWEPPEGFPFHGGDIRYKYLVIVFDISKHDRAIYYHVGTHHDGEVPLRRVPHESQGASRSLGPLVLPTGETFAILRHRVEENYGTVHAVMIVEAVCRHIEDNLPPR